MTNPAEFNTKPPIGRFLHQIGLPGLVVLITSPKGKVLQPLANGVSHGAHWAVYKHGQKDGYGEVIIKDGLISIIKVLPEGNRPIWQVAVKDMGKKAPDGWEVAVGAALEMAVCGANEKCPGHWPVYSTQYIVNSKQGEEIKKPEKKVYESVTWRPEKPGLSKQYTVYREENKRQKPEESTQETVNKEEVKMKKTGHSLQDTVYSKPERPKKKTIKTEKKVSEEKPKRKRGRPRKN